MIALRYHFTCICMMFTGHRWVYEEMQIELAIIGLRERGYGAWQA